MPSTIENKLCGLLTNDENLQVFKLLGSRCQTMATTVIQLYVTTPPNHSQWFKKDTGILCFVKDNVRKNYFFRLYCLRRNCIIWEHEIYNNMEYMESTSFLHIFEGEEGIVAFNFASLEEAAQLKSIVVQKIQLKKKREEKKAKLNQSQSLHPPLNNFNGNNNLYKKSPNPEAKLAKRKRNITKADISVPMDFKHISHVGFNPNSGFDILSEDEQLKSFFQKAGVTEKQLQDVETREFIYDFINKHGGREAVEAVNGPPPAVPPRGPQRTPHGRAAPPPPPPPTSMRPPESYVPKKPAPVPKPPMVSPSTSAPSAPPPPPPPPPMMDVPSPPAMNGTNGGAGVPPPPPLDNSALMESIRSGTSLKHVEERKPVPQDDARGDLLSEIRKGMKLKPVDEREVKSASSPKQAGGSDLAGALARALAERSKAIHSEDDSEDTGSSNEDDWED